MKLITPPRRFLARVPVSDLLAEVRRREQLLAELRRKHATIVAKLDRLDEKIAELGNSPARMARRGRGSSGAQRMGRQRGHRVRNAIPLHAAMHAALLGKTMTAGELGETLLRSGYKTNSNHFHQIVAITFLKHKGLFKRVARGKYTAK